MPHGSPTEPAPHAADAPAAGPEDDRVREIVDAACALIEDGGLERLTIRAVLARTGLARRAFYERFAGKDDLVLAVFGHAMRLAARRYERRIAAVADPLDRLRLIVTSIALGTSSDDGVGAGHSDRQGTAMSREHLRLAESRPADLQAAIAPLLDLVARLLSEGMAAGSVRAGSPDRLAMLVYNLVSTTVHAELIGRDGTAADPRHRLTLAADVWEFCRRGIAATG